MQEHKEVIYSAARKRLLPGSTTQIITVDGAEDGPAVSQAYTPVRKQIHDKRTIVFQIIIDFRPEAVIEKVSVHVHYIGNYS